MFSTRTPVWRFVLTLATTVLSVSACNDEPAGPEDVLPFGSVSGEVVAPGATTFGQLTARIRWGEQDVTAAVAPDGSFEVTIPESVSGFGRLTIEPGPSEPFHPAWVLLSPGDIGSRGTIVLAPKTWTPSSGDYAGLEIPIDPELAADTRVLPSFWGFYFPYSQQGFLQTITDNTMWAAEFRGWPQASFPLPLALDRPGSEGDFSAADSVVLWSHVDAMEQALGFDAFRPVRIEDVQILGGTRRAAGAVLVQLHASQAFEGEGVVSLPEPSAWGFSADATTWSGTAVARIDMVSADIAHAVVGLRASGQVQDRQLVIHELMHTLGAGHGCSWASVTTYCASLATDVPSPGDVAHLAVMREMRALELQHGTLWGVVSAVIGHRVVTLGLAPAPGLDLRYGPASVRSDWR